MINTREVFNDTINNAMVDEQIHSALLAAVSSAMDKRLPEKAKRRVTINIDVAPYDEYDPMTGEKIERAGVTVTAEVRWALPSHVYASKYSTNEEDTRMTV